MTLTAEEQRIANREAALIRQLGREKVIGSKDVIRLSEEFKLLPSRVLANARAMGIKIGER